MIEKNTPPALGALPSPNAAGDPADTGSDTGSDIAVQIELAPDAMQMEEAAAMGLLQSILPAPPPFDANLAEFVEETDLNRVAGDLIADFEQDLRSRHEWERVYRDGLELLGFNYEQRTQPWEGACGAFYPLLGEAAVKFQSEAIAATFPAAGPVRTAIIGQETRDLHRTAKRVAEDMNYRLTEQMDEYRTEHERLLWSLALAGSAFKKMYYDSTLGRPVALFVPVEDMIVPYGTTSLLTAERITHRMRKTHTSLRKLQLQGFYRDIEIDEPTLAVVSADTVEEKKAQAHGFDAVADNRHILLEIHATFVLPGFDEEGTPGSPYVITVEQRSGKVLAVRRNWLPDDQLKLPRQHFVDYCYVPGFGFYGFGLIHMIGGFAKAGTSLLRQLVDAGTLSNLPGGFKTRGMRIKGDDTPIEPGEWRDVDIPSGVLRDNIVPLPYKEPSQVLAGLLDRIVNEARRLAATADPQFSDISANTPVGTTLAVLERTLKVMSAIHARLHNSMRKELRLLKALIREYLPPAYEYQPDDGEPGVKQADYDAVEVLPVSDPNASTLAQRVVQYQAVLQLAQTAPQLYDLPQLHRQMLDVMEVDGVDALLPNQQAMPPMDPVTENMSIMTGKPVRAHLHQDHEAHLAVHMAAAQDPLIQAQLSQQPNAQMVQAAFLAHINEHMAFAYRKRMEQQMGVTLPPPEQALPPEIEVQLSAAMAEGAQRVLQQSQAQQQAQQAQEAAQDPMVQLELREQARKEAKDQMDAQLRQEEIASRERQTAATNAARLMESQAELASRERGDTRAIAADMAAERLKAQQQAQQQFLSNRPLRSE